jgi:GrpB-like predicted nucleotidyltransferase (UPF0157 family)
MIALGHLPQGECGIPGRRFFVKGEESLRTHHVPVFQSGNPEIQRHLGFWDHLRVHPQKAQAYSRLQEELARRFPEDGEGCLAGKDEFIRRIEAQAREWRGR